MDFIRYAVDTIFHTIPREILDLAFSSQYSYRNVVSLEALVEKNIVLGRMSLDMNLVRGNEIVIPVSKMSITHQGIDGVALLIPERLTAGRKVMSVLSAGSGLATAAPQAMSGPLGAAKTLQQNMSGMSGAYSNIRAEVLSDYEIFVYDVDLITPNMMLRLVVEYSNRFNELNPRTYPSLVKLIEHAAKAQIWTKLVIGLNQGELYHGHEISIVKELIDEYKDSHEIYQEELHFKAAKVLLMNDSESMERYVRSMISNF